MEWKCSKMGDESEIESEVAQLCPTLCDPMDCSLQAVRPWDFPGKNTGVGCHFLLQEIFPTQGLNPGLPHRRQMLYHLSHQGSQSRRWGRGRYKYMCQRKWEEGREGWRTQQGARQVWTQKGRRKRWLGQSVSEYYDGKEGLARLLEGFVSFRNRPATLNCWVHRSSL